MVLFVLVTTAVILDWVVLFAVADVTFALFVVAVVVDIVSRDEDDNDDCWFCC